MVHFAGVAAFDNQGDRRALLRTNKVMVHRRNGKQRRDRRSCVIGVAVGDHQGACTFGDGVTRAQAQLLQGVDEALPTPLDVIEGLQDGRPQATVLAVGVDMDDLVEFVVVENRPTQHDLPAGRRGRLEEVLLRPHHPRHRGDDLFADGIQRRIRHLRKEFDEVVVEQPGPLRQHRSRSVGSHGTQGFGPRSRHWGEQDAKVFLGVAESDLPAHDGLVIRLHSGTVGQRLDVEQPGVQPLGVRLLSGERFLDLVVRNDAAGRGVDEEHLSRLQAALGDDLCGRHIEHATLAGEDDAVVKGAPPSSGT